MEDNNLRRKAIDLEDVLACYESTNHNLLWRNRYVLEIEKSIHPVLREVLLVQVEHEKQWRMVVPTELEIEILHRVTKRCQE